MRGLARVSERADALERAVPRFLRAVEPDALMAHVARVSAHDRYQASHGIERAAEQVAAAADASGLEQVRIERFPADGAVRWWSFAAPRAWTPLRALLEVRAPDDGALILDHARDPFAVATHSAATPRGGLRAPLVPVAGPRAAHLAAGALALVERDALADGELERALAAAGALGLAAGGGTHRGRVELDPRTPLVGFSVTAGELARLRAWADAGALAHAHVEIDRGAAMPLVTAVLPGEGDLASEEVWLIAHLCHPRPSANDNASGVAALLGVAAALAAARRAGAEWAAARTIRFAWGPEIVGTAALLHGAARPPVAVVNLDMVGEDQRLCGGPFLVERNPDCVPGLVAPAAEQVVEEVFARTRASARAGEAAWRPAAFAGFSDHALFAGPHCAAPAVHLCHAPDRFNHSAADAPDKVCPRELARATVAGAALALILASEPRVARPVLARALASWSAREQAAAATFVGDPAWDRARLAYVRRRSALLRAQLDGAPPQAPRAAAPAGEPSDAPALAARWEGPLNARALLADLARAGAEGAALAARVRADRGLHALLVNVAIRCDGTRSAAQLTAETSLALGRPLPAATLRELTDALLACGWAALEPARAAATAG